MVFEKEYGELNQMFNGLSKDDVGLVQKVLEDNDSVEFETLRKMPWYSKVEKLFNKKYAEKNPYLVRLALFYGLQISP